MRRYRIALGVLIGLAGAWVAIAMLQRRPPALPAGGAILSDCDGALKELVIHYVPEAAAVTARPYRDFLKALAGDVRVHVVCPDRAAFDDLAARVGPTACELRPVPVGHAMTTWSRDRWVATGPEGQSPTVLLAPREERGGDIWPDRRGDGRVAGDLADALGKGVAWRRSGLSFDGGDFVADSRTVFVAPGVLRRNFQNTVRTREELIDRLGAAMKREVVLLDTAPDHHAGMFLMPVGDRTVLVGDPAAGRKLLPRDANDLVGADGPDFRPETRALFDAVADTCKSAGYRVVRVPLAPGRDGRTYLTYLNVLLDRRRGRRVVYMPVFDGADALNAEGARVWTSLGWEVRTVNCTSSYRHFGSLRCLVNVLSRGRRARRA